jgi:hypothetical protein
MPCGTIGVEVSKCIGSLKPGAVATIPVDIGPIGIEPVDIEPGDIEPGDIEPGDIEPVDIEPVDIEPVDMPPIDMGTGIGAEDLAAGVDTNVSPSSIST